MNIFYDENMPFAREFFGDLGTLVPFAGRELRAEQVKDADVLLVRSITQVNEALLRHNQRLQFVGTATIGVDHIDQSYLASRHIHFTAAPGCNAVSVAEYVVSALVVMAERQQRELGTMRVGIVGAGNTGSRLSEKLQALGIPHLLCDPPLAEAGCDPREFSSLDQVLACDVISLHVPLTRSGEHASFHMLDEHNLTRLDTQQILINVCRGEVVDNQALLRLKQQGLGPALVWDVWENEPDILLPLLPYTDIATAHIAGYSLEGKSRGTEMLYQALCRQLNKAASLSLAQFLPAADIASVKLAAAFNGSCRDSLIKLVYDVRRDDAIFRQQINTRGFDQIRKTYPVRREFSSLVVTSDSTANVDAPHRLGFSK